MRVLLGGPAAPSAARTSRRRGPGPACRRTGAGRLQPDQQALVGGGAPGPGPDSLDDQHRGGSSSQGSAHPPATQSYARHPGRPPGRERRQHRGNQQADAVLEPVPAAVQVLEAPPPEPPPAPSRQPSAASDVLPAAPAPPVDRHHPHSPHQPPPAPDAPPSAAPSAPAVIAVHRLAPGPGPAPLPGWPAAARHASSVGGVAEVRVVGYRQSVLLEPGRPYVVRADHHRADAAMSANAGTATRSQAGPGRNASATHTGTMMTISLR